MSPAKGDSRVMRCDTLWRKARLATMAGDGPGIVEAGLLAAQDGRIVYAGPAAGAPALDAAASVDCDGRWITPGLLDCHPHQTHTAHPPRQLEPRPHGPSPDDLGSASRLESARQH